MARVKRGTTSKAKHKKVLKAAKGYWGIPQYPLAAFKTFLCFALLVVPLLTLAILSS